MTKEGVEVIVGVVNKGKLGGPIGNHGTGGRRVRDRDGEVINQDVSNGGGAEAGVCKATAGYTPNGMALDTNPQPDIPAPAIPGDRSRDRTDSHQTFCTPYSRMQLGWYRDPCIRRVREGVKGGLGANQAREFFYGWLPVLLR